MQGLELKKIQHSVPLSEETHCYSADIYLGGKKVGTTRNRGTGGADEVRWTSLEAKAIVDKELPGGCFEDWCAQRVDDFVVLKIYRRRMAGGKVIATMDNGDIREWKFKGHRKNPTDDQIARVVGKNPGIKTVWNDLDNAALLAEVRAWDKCVAG